MLCLDETKLDASFPDTQFHIEGYQYPPFRRDRDKNGGGKIIFIREGLIAKRLYAYEDSTSETIWPRNRPRNFQRTSLIETGMSDCHKLILSLFRAFFKRITTKTIQYLNCSNFSLEAFSTNWTKNSTKVSCTIVKINSMICFQIFSEQFLIIMLP